MLKPGNDRFFNVRVDRLRARFFLILGLVLYIVAFNWLYIHWLAPTFSYYGFTYHQPSDSMVSSAWAFSILPSFWMPIAFTRTSQLPYWILYLLVYIPSMFGPLFMALQPPRHLEMLMLSVFAGFIVITLSYLIPVKKIMPDLVSSRVFWGAFTTVTLLLNLWVVAIFHSHMKLVGFMDVYSQRSMASEVQTGSNVAYAAMWLSSVINPFIMARALVLKKPGLFSIGVCGQILIYSTGGDKASVLSIPILLGFYLLFRRNLQSLGIKLVGVLLLLLVSISVAALTLNPESGSLASYAIGLIFMRTVANGGFTTGLFDDFFSRHPYTYMSHVHIIDRLVHNPYDRQLGMVLGFYEAQNPELDLNAHLWATDGIAGFGLPGIILISCLCGLCFWILDCAASRQRLLLSTLMVSFVTLNLANLSLFTAIVSGGGGLVTILFLAMPSDPGTNLGYPRRAVVEGILLQGDTSSSNPGAIKGS